MARSGSALALERALLVVTETLAHDELVLRSVYRGSDRGAVVGDGDRCGASGLVRYEVERCEPVWCVQVAVGRPGRRLGRGDRRVLALRASWADAGDQDTVMRLVEGPGRCRCRVAATADDHMHGAERGVHQRRVAALRRRSEQVAAGQHAAHGEGALEVMFVPGYDQVYAVPVEQRQPMLSDAQVGAVEVGRGHRDLVHAYHDPVDVVVLLRGGQLRLQPLALRA